MTGIEIAVGFVFAWAVRKARRVAGRADEEVDRTLDAGMDRLHELVSRKLGDDRALQKLVKEAEAGQAEPSERTRQWVGLALEDAYEQDPDFAESLDQAVKHLEELYHRPAGGISAADGGVAVGGPVVILAEHNSAAAVNMGNVTMGNPPLPGQTQG